MRLVPAVQSLLSCGILETDKYTVAFQVALFYTQDEFYISHQLVSLEVIV